MPIKYSILCNSNWSTGHVGAILQPKHWESWERNHGNHGKRRKESWEEKKGITEINFVVVSKLVVITSLAPSASFPVARDNMNDHLPCGIGTYLRID